MGHLNIYQYCNYREYLKDYYLLEKSKKTGFTYARFSLNAGLGSPNYLKLVIDCKKNLTQENIIKFSKALCLEGYESDYFETLVFFNQSKKDLEKSFYQEKMIRIKDSTGRSEQKKLEEFEFESIAKWSYHAVMLLTNLPDFRESPKWISKKLYNLVSEEEASHILERLLVIGLIKYDESGVLKQTYKQVQTKDELNRLGARLFYEGLFNRVNETFQIDEASERELGNYMVGISAEQLPEIRKRARKFLREINQLALENPSPERIYSFSFSAIPLSIKEDVRLKELWQ